MGHLTRMSELALQRPSLGEHKRSPSGSAFPPHQEFSVVCDAGFVLQSVVRHDFVRKPRLVGLEPCVVHDLLRSQPCLWVCMGAH